MRTILFCLTLLSPSLLLGCKSAPVVPANAIQARVDANGGGTVHPVKIFGIAATPGYTVTGTAVITAQWPEKPHLTIDGDYTTVVTSVPGVGLSPSETPDGNVLIRVPNPSIQIKDPTPAVTAHPLPPAGGHQSGCNENATNTNATNVKATNTNANAKASISAGANTCNQNAAGDCSLVPSSTPPPAPSATPPASANGRASAASPVSGTSAARFGQTNRSSAPPVSAANTTSVRAGVDPCAPAPVIVASTPEVCLPSVRAGAPARKCGDPVYVSPAKRDCEAAVEYDRAAMGRGLRPGQVGLSPFEDCSLPKAGESLCPRGVPAIVQGLLDLFSGKAF